MKNYQKKTKTYSNQCVVTHHINFSDINTHIHTPTINPDMDIELYLLLIVSGLIAVTV